MNKPTDQDNKTLPFTAYCHNIKLNAHLRWLKLGWQDIKQAPMPSLGYGALIVAFSYLRLAQ